MVAETGARKAKTRQQIEAELMAELEEAEQRLDAACPDAKSQERERFCAALKRFNAFILDGKLPEEGK